jgi:hypothetical protein
LARGGECAPEQPRERLAIEGDVDCPPDTDVVERRHARVEEEEDGVGLRADM